VSLPAQLVPATLSLAAVLSWGTSDFLGGYAARRADAFLLTTVAHSSGLLLVLILASGTHARFPSLHSVEWALAGGVSGGLALAVFYRALAGGSMGLTAPVAAVLGAAVPTIFGIVTEGAPGPLHMAGFMLAGLGIWLISRTEGGNSPAAIAVAALAGIGFAGFYLCVRQARDGSAFWIATFSRTGALAVTGAVVLARRRFREISLGGIRWGMIAGCLDVMGTVFFIRASQTGRLDAAVVLTSLYPAVTVLLARLVLREHFTRWKVLGMFAALAAVPMITAP